MNLTLPNKPETLLRHCWSSLAALELKFEESGFEVIQFKFG